MSHFLDHDLVSTNFNNENHSTNNNNYELFRLQQQEEYKRQVYVQHRCNLQETWENLVKLRQLVHVFNSNIEKAAEEEVKEFDQNHPTDRTSHSSSTPQSHTTHHDSNSRLQYDMYMNGVKLKMKLKDDLKSTLSQKEISLQQMKLDLESQSKQLYSLNGTPSMIQNNNANTDGLHNDTQPNVSAYLELRRSILTLSNQIEATSAEFQELSIQYTKVETEITESLINTPALLTNSTTPTSIATNVTNGTTNSESILSALSTGEGSNSVKNSNDNRKGFWKVEGGVTIVDVLSGRANLYRISGK